MASNNKTNNRMPALATRFDGHSEDYKTWREQRLSLATLQPPGTISLPLGAILDHASLPAASSSAASENHAATRAAIATLCDQVRVHGYAVYQVTDHEQQALRNLSLTLSQAFASALAHTLGLHLSDEGVIRDAGNLSLLRDLSGTPQGRFIPYTSKAMNWHTDGYYNSIDNSLRCFTLHCVQPAAEGGALTLMDPELLLIALHEDDPAWLAELAHPEAMMLPANTDRQGHNRPDRTAPIFFCHADGELGLRFTTRSENIRWRRDETAQAAARATQLVDSAAQWHTTLRLQAGQGVITRNVLHRRDAFSEHGDSAGRQMLRGRFLQLPSCVATDYTHAVGSY